MNSKRVTVQTLCAQQDGQMLAEYLLILSMILGVVFTTFSIYTGPLSEIYASINEAFSVFGNGASL